ncbi:uncharacterized protein LOC122243147 [Penaeus japonicus]|uniref:uncharacterized protein LOC122243147 n=1 Tax=Penaeus japonicus TaxID=27405 RepID=UPI001C7155A6|nr:uncharacterized protein LOC122243147 [Penaeus japonicus]
MILWLVLTLAAGMCLGFPTNVNISPETPLDSLTLDELDQLLSDKLAELQVNIMNNYEQQLRQHEDALHHLQRHRRDSSNLQLNLPPPQNFDQDNWHAYVYDTHITRDISSVTQLSVHKFANVQTVVDVFPVDLDNIHAIYKLDSGYGFILSDQEMKLLMVRNQWTKSPTGCACPGAATSDTRCACCAPGGVLCTVLGNNVSDTCVEDSKLLADECVGQSPRPLTLDSAIAFEYRTYNPHNPNNRQQVVVIAKDKVVNFYILDEWGLQDLHSKKGHSTIHLNGTISHLGYGEVFVEEFGSIVKKRFLFVFGPDGSSNHFYQVLINAEDDSIETGFSNLWNTTGTLMKTWQNGGRVIIGVQDGTNLNIHELTTDNWGRQDVTLQQVIVLPGDVISWRRYATGFNNHLVVVTPNSARVYVETRGQYHVLQTLSPSGGVPSFSDIVPVNLPSCSNDVVLMTGLGSTLQIFVWDGSQESYIQANETTLPVSITGWAKGFTDIRSISTSIPKVILESSTGVVGINVIAQMVEIENPVWDESVALTNQKQHLENEYKRQRQVMLNVEERLSNSVSDKVDPAAPSINITGDVTILGGLFINKTLTVVNLEANDLLFPNTDLASGVTYDEYKAHLADIENNKDLLQDLSNKLDSMETSLQDAVSLTTSKKITGTKTVVNGLTVQNLGATNASFQTVFDTNDQVFPLTSTLEGLVKFADMRKIKGKKTFTKRLDVTNLETESLDDVPVSDLATTTGEYAITGSVSFAKSLKAKNINMPQGGTVGGLDLSNAVTLTGPVKLGYIVMDKNLTVADNMQVDSTDVDGVIINQLYRNALTKAGGKLKGPLAFINDVTAKSLTADLLSGVSSSTFLSTTVFKDEDAQLTGKLTVPTLVTKSLQVGGLVNGKNFPSDFPLKTAATLDLGTKSFNHLICESVQVSNVCTVDGVLFSNLVTLHGAQIITGRKIMKEGIEIQGNLNVTTSLIGGVNFTDVYTNLFATLNPSGKGFDIHFKNYVSVPTIVYSGSLNGLNLVDLGQDIIYSTDSTAKISGIKTFGNSLTISKANFVSTFNGKSFEELVNSFSTKNIAGIKTFKKPVTFASNVNVTGLVDNVNLKTLFDSALYLDKAGQVVTGRKTFTNGVSAGRLQVQGKVSDVDFNMVLTKNGDQVFTAPQQLAAASFGALDTNQIDMSNGFKVNGIDISELDSIRMSRKNPTAHSGTLTVNGLVSVLGSLDVESINGNNVAQLKNNIVTDDVDSVISSDVHIASLTVKGSVTTANKGGANGLNISRIAENAVYLNGNNVMTGSVTWGDLNLQGDVAVGGLVNGKDLQVVHNDAVYKDDNLVQLTGKKIFENGISVKGNINTATTNGIDLGTRLFTRHTDQDITAAFTFSSISTEKNLTLDGTFDEVDLEKLDYSALKQSVDSVVNIDFGGEVTVGDFHVGGNLGGVSVTQRLKDAVRLNAKDVTISGQKTFTKNVTFKDISTQTLNKMDLDTYLTHAVRKNAPINLNKGLKVNGIVSAPSITANSLGIQGTVDGTDFRDLMTKAVLLDGSQTSSATLQFPSGVAVVGNLIATNLNDLKMDTHYLTTNTPQTFTTNVQFGDITSTANVAVTGKVNGVNLPAESANTLKIQGGQTVTGLKQIQGLTVVENNVEVSQSTGSDALVDFSSEVVYLTEDAAINGVLQFTSNLTAKTLSSSSNEIGDLDLVDLADNSWYYNEDAIITAKMNFTGSTLVKGKFLTTQPLDGMLISDVYAEVESAISSYSTYNEGIKNVYINKCPLIKEAYLDTQRAIFDADYFTLENELEFGGKRKSSASVRVGNYSYIVMTWDQECNVDLYKYGTSLVPTKLQYSNVGFGKDLMAFESQGNNYFIMAASPANNSCSRTNSVVFKLENDNLIVHQELVAGEKLEKVYVKESGTMGISITMGNTAHIYTYSTSTNLFENVKSSPAVDIVATLLDQSGNAIVLTRVAGKATLSVNGNFLQEMEVNNVFDAVIVEQQEKVFLVLSVARKRPSGVEYNLELYLVAPATGFSWLDSINVHEPAKLTSFFAGNSVTGTTLIVTVQENWYTEVYSLIGTNLKLLVQLNTPCTHWAEYFSVPDATFNEVSKHHIILGNGQVNTAKLLELKMNGLTHEAGDLECNPGAFKYPELMPVVPVF